MDINVFNVYFIWALENKTDIIFVLYPFRRMWWEIDWYPLLKSIVLINIGNSFFFPSLLSLQVVRLYPWGWSFVRMLLIWLFSNTKHLAAQTCLPLKGMDTCALTNTHVYICTYTMERSVRLSSLYYHMQSQHTFTHRCAHSSAKTRVCNYG